VVHNRGQVTLPNAGATQAHAPGCPSTYAGKGRRPQSSHTIPYRLTPADVTAIWRRTSRWVHELTGPRNLCRRVTSGTTRTAPPTAGHAGACSAQTRFGPWLVTAIQPHASHATSINTAPIEGMRTSRARSSQSIRLPRAPAMLCQKPDSRASCRFGSLADLLVAIAASASRRDTEHGSRNDGLCRAQHVPAPERCWRSLGGRRSPPGGTWPQAVGEANGPVVL